MMMRLAGLSQDLHPAAERTVRQVLLHSLYSDLQPGILLGLTDQPALLAAPASWRRWLRARKIHVPPLRGRIKYASATLTGAAIGLSLLVKTVVLFLQGRIQAAPDEAYDVFLDLPPAFLPLRTAKPQTSIIAWVTARNDDRPLWVHCSGTGAMLHSVVYVPNPLPAFPSYASFLTFMVLSVRATVIGFAAAFLGRGELLLILKDIVLLAHARAVGPDRLALRYIGENSRWYYRPLFTEWASHTAGSGAVLLFYATNMDECLRMRSVAPAACFVPGYEIMSWDRYLAWDDHQADLIEAWGHDRTSVEVVGAVPLADPGNLLPELPSCSIAVFDIAPHTPIALALRGLVPAYYQDEIAAAFLLDLQSVARACGIPLVFKQKRASKSTAPPKYRAAMERLHHDPNVRILPPEIGADRVVTQCRVTISAPFSSPSLLAKMAGRPASFYDPTGRLIASKRQRHDIPLLAGREELKAWVAQHLDDLSASPSTVPNP